MPASFGLCLHDDLNQITKAGLTSLVVRFDIGCAKGSSTFALGFVMVMPQRG